MDKSNAIELGSGVLFGYGTGTLGALYIAPELRIGYPHHWVIGFILFIIAVIFGSYLLAGFGLGLVINDWQDIPKILE